MTESQNADFQDSLDKIHEEIKTFPTGAVIVAAASVIAEEAVDVDTKQVEKLKEIFKKFKTTYPYKDGRTQDVSTFLAVAFIQEI